MKPDKMELYYSICEALPILTNQEILLTGLYNGQNVTHSRKSKERTKNLSIIVLYKIREQFQRKEISQTVTILFFFFTDYEKICYFCLH